MAEENSNVEVSDRGLFGFGKKDEVKNEEEGLVTGVQNLRVDESRPVEKKEEEKKGSLLTKLHRSDSSSSSSSSDEEEVGPDGEIKKKKKLREKLKGKFGGDKKDETAHAPTTPVPAAPVTGGHVAKPDNTNVVIEKLEEDVKVEPAKEEEKKGFLEKIKDKLPGHGAKKETAPAFPSPAPPVPVSTSTEEVEGGEKKGLLGKIMDKIPGYHKEEKEADKTAAH